MKIKLLIISLLFSIVSWGQTNPAVQSLPYSQNFSSLAAASTTYPTGWQGWTVSTAPGATFKTNAPTADRALVASSTAAVNSGNVHNYNGKIGFLNSGSLDLSIVLSINTTSLSNVSVGYDVMTIRNPYDGTTNTKISEVTLQYRIGNAGAFTSLTGIEYQNNTSLQIGTVTTPQNSQSKSITLPVGCENKSEVQLRWIAREVSGVGSRASFAFDNIAINGTPPATTSVSVSTLSGFGYVESFGPSGEQNFTATGSNLTADMVFTAPTNYELSLTSGGVFTNSVSITPSSGSVNAPVFVRLKAGLTANTYNGEDISVTSIGATAKTVTCSGTVIRPTITLTPTTLTGFSYVLGSGPSAEQTFTASGINLSADIVLTAPTNYEISLTSGAGFGSSINLVPTTGTVPAATIYVRLIAGLSVNVYNGESITATSTNAVNKTVTCDGSVSGSLPVINSSLTDSSVYGSGYNYAITVSGAAATSYSATSLPAGLSIDTATGIISGTPLVGVGSYNIGITATNGSGSDTETLVLTITAKNLTITGLNADDKVYDRTLTATLSGTPALVGIVSSDDVTVSGTPSATFATAVVGTAKPVSVTNYTLSGAQAANYTVTQPTGLTANITVKPLTVTGAVANNKVYNGTNTATITGATLVGVIAPDVVNITPSGTFATVNAGTAIAVTSTSSISGADASNYSLTQPTGLVADITQASQTITFGTLVYQYVGVANFNLAATASSGLAITYVSSNPAVATISGNTVTVVGTGTTIITASQAGDINYTAAASVSQNQLVTTAPCLISNFDSSTAVPGGWSGSSVNDAVATHYQSAPNCRALAATKDLITSAIDNPASINFYVDASGSGGQIGTLWYRIGAGSWISVGTFIASTAGATVTFDLASISVETNVSFKISSATNTIYIDDLKIFCGTVWNGSAWSNGTPTLASFAAINGDYDTTSHGDIQAYNLTVNPTFTATVAPSNYVTIQNNLTVNGALNIQSNGSLVQINDSGVNTGNINMERTAIADRLDYVYWSTPVSPFNAADISLTSDNTKLYKWIPTVSTNVNGHGTWVSGNEVMVLGQGYIERGLNNSTTDVPFTATFTGVPNNGVINIPISRGTYDSVATYDTTMSSTYATKDDDNWNLLGNPYPSSISLYEFLTTNTNIGGFVKIWKHGLAPTSSNPNPFYNTYGYNYNAADYTTYNLSGSSAGSASDFFIGAGQGFIVLMNANTGATTENVAFRNVMRNKNYQNDLFFKSGSSARNASQERGRIWLDIVSSTINRRAMVGYIDGATNGNDRLFDAITDLKMDMTIYSLIGFEGQVVQGRSLPFDQNDQVPLGVKVPTNGTYNIAIGEVDGFFANPSQNIYLEDKALNVIHDLRTAPYQFTEVAGIKNDRFVLRYTNQTLGNDQFEVSDNSVKIHVSDNSIVINSLVEPIKAYEVYNVLGQTLASKKQVKVNKTEETSIQKGNQALIVKVTLENGKSFTKKVIY